MCSFAFLRLPSSNLYNGSFYKLQMCFCIVIPLSKISNQAQLRCVGIPYSSSEKKCSLHVYQVDSYCARMKKDLKKKSWRKSFKLKKNFKPKKNVCGLEENKSTLRNDCRSVGICRKCVLRKNQYFQQDCLVYEAYL